MCKKYRVTLLLLIAVGLLAASVESTIAAPKSKKPIRAKIINNENHPIPVKIVADTPIGTWTQEGVDANGDGVISEAEATPVIIFQSHLVSNVKALDLTVQNPNCQVNFFGDLSGTGALGDIGTYNVNVPPGHTRLAISISNSTGSALSNITSMTADCTGCGPDNCEYTVTDVQLR